MRNLQESDQRIPLLHPHRANNSKNTSSPTSPFGRYRFAFYLLAIAAAYLPILFADFLFDDYFNLRNALSSGWSWSGLMRNFVISSDLIGDGWQLPAFAGFVVRYFRPLFLWSLLADHALWGLHAWGYHLTNILLHLGVVGAFYGVLREILGDRQAMPAYGALLFGVMHTHVPAVCWLSGRTELLPALGMMVALWGWLRFGRTRTRGWYALSAAAAAASLFCKENAVIFPVLALAAWLWLMPRPRVSVWLIAPYAALVTLYLILRDHTLGGFPLPPRCFYYHPPNEPGFVGWALAKTVCVFFGMVFQAPLLFPTDMALQRRPAILVLLLIVVAAITVWLFRLVRGERNDAWRRHGYFAMAWIFLGLSPTAPLLITNLYYYFPMAGMCLLILAVWSRLVERGRPRWLHLPGWRKAIPILAVAFSMAAIQPGNVLLMFGTRLSNRLVNEAEAAAGEIRDGMRLFVLDVPALASHMKSALALRHLGKRFEVHLMSVSPYLLPGIRDVSSVEQPDERTLILTATGMPYFSGVVGLVGFCSASRDSLKAGNVFGVKGYRVEFAENVLYGRPPELCVRKIIYRFDEPMGWPGNVFIRFSEGRFERMEMN